MMDGRGSVSGDVPAGDAVYSESFFGITARMTSPLIHHFPPLLKKSGYVIARYLF